MGMLFDQLLNKTNTTISQYVTLVNNIEHFEDHYIGQHGMGIAIQFKSGDVDLLSENDYITFQMNQVVQIRENNTISKSKTALPYEVWGHNYPFDDTDEIDRLGIDSYYCPQSYDYSIQGTYYSDTFKYIELKAYRWSNSTSCRSTDEINTILNTAKFEVALIDFYVDNSDYVSPVKSLIRDGLFWNTIPGYDMKSDIYIGRNYGIFQDNYFQFYNSYEISYYSLMDRRDYTNVEDSDGELVALYFRTYSYESSSERRIYSFGDFLAQSGGVYGFFIIIGTSLFLNYANLGSAIITTFTDRLYASSLLRMIYQIDTFKDDFKLQREIPKSVKNETHIRFDSSLRWNNEQEVWKSDHYRDKVLKNMKQIEKNSEDPQHQNALLERTLKGKVDLAMIMRF